MTDHKETLSVIESRGFLLSNNTLNWINLHTPHFLANDPPNGQARYNVSPAWMNSLDSGDLQLRLRVLDFSDGSQKVDVCVEKGEEHIDLNLPEPYRLTKDSPEMLIQLDGDTTGTASCLAVTAIKTIHVGNSVRLATRVFTCLMP